VTSLDPNEPARPRMTIRVYRVSRDGTVTGELGEVQVMGDEPLAPLFSGRFPPCRCPRHRDASGPRARSGR
jgi:hypothetical protein